jgi:PEP-CTERM/exosortase A-associated glycosyltransferase
MKDAPELIVNADEFGRSPGINRGIIEAHQAGVVTSASAMVRRPAAEGAAEAARAHPGLGVGLHVDLGEWALRDGKWVQVERVVDPSDPPAVEAEVHRQLERFRILFGSDPTHLDSHQNVHRSGPAMAILGELAHRLRVPLRHFTPGVRVISGFHGQTSRGHAFPEGISVRHLRRILLTLSRGTNELVCHPGRSGDAGGSYREERIRELQTLLDPGVRELFASGPIRLRSFRGVPAVPAGNGGIRQTEAALRAQGQAAFRKGDFRTARTWFEKAVVVGGDRPWPWLWLARAQLRGGDPQGSRASIQQALSLEPGWPEGLLHVADLHLAMGRWEEAAELLHSLASRNGTGASDLPAGIARRLRSVEDPQEALRVAEALCEQHPGNGHARGARAVALWRLGAREEARRWVAPRNGTADLEELRGALEFHLEVGEADAAWKLLRSAPRGEVESGLAARVAHGLRRSGELTRAWEAFEVALAAGGRGGSVRRWREVVVGEVQVLSGAWRPSLPRIPHYRAVPGRVLHLVGRSLPHVQTGYSVRTRYVTRCQKAAGLDPQVVTQLGFPWSEEVEEAPHWEEVDGIPHHRIPGPPSLPPRLDERMDRNVEALLELVRRVRPAALHAASDYRNALLALEVGRACGIPVVYEVRGFWEETWSSKQEGDDAEGTVAYQWRRDREIECMRRADRVVTLAEVMREEMAGRGVLPAKVTVVPNAVDPQAFRPVQRDPELAQRLGLGDAEVVVGYVSSFVAYEGIQYLIDAVAELASRGLPVRGLLVGDGEERSALEARARELGVEGRVLFTGRVPHEEVASYYGLIDAFVVPRTGDRVCHLVTPLKPYEAMAMERAVVVSGVRALREMVIPGETGLVFRPEDPRDLADVLEPLVRSPQRRKELGRAARTWVQAHRTWDQNGERYAALYRELGVLPERTPDSAPRDRMPGGQGRRPMAGRAREQEKGTAGRIPILGAP